MTQVRGRRYQDYEIFGSHGRIRRPGDRADPPLLIQREGHAGWDAIPLDAHDDDGRPLTPARRYELFAAMVRERAPHPLSGDSALRDLAIVMGVYESALRRAIVTMPPQEPRFPLEVLIERGEL